MHQVPTVAAVVSSLESTLLQEEDKRAQKKQEHVDALDAARALISRKKHLIAAVKERLAEDDVRWKSAFLVAAKYVEVAQRQATMIMGSDSSDGHSAVMKKLQDKILEKECKEVAIELLLDDCEHQLALTEQARDHLYQELRQTVYDLTEVEAYRSAISSRTAEPASTSGWSVSEPTLRKELSLLRGGIQRIQNKLAVSNPDPVELRSEANALSRHVETFEMRLTSLGYLDPGAETGAENLLSQIHSAQQRLRKAEEREQVLQMIIEEQDQQLMDLVNSASPRKSTSKAVRANPVASRPSPNTSDYSAQPTATATSHLRPTPTSPTPSSPGGALCPDDLIYSERAASVVAPSPSLGLVSPTIGLGQVAGQVTGQASSWTQATPAGGSGSLGQVDELLAAVLDLAPLKDRQQLMGPLSRALGSSAHMTLLLKMAFTHDVASAESLAIRLWTFFSVKLSKVYLRLCLLPAFDTARVLMARRVARAGGVEPTTTTVVEIAAMFLQSVFDSMNVFPWALHEILNHGLSVVNSRFRQEGLNVVCRLFFGHLLRGAVVNPGLYSMHYSATGEYEPGMQKLLVQVGNMLGSLVDAPLQRPVLLESVLSNFLQDNRPIVREFMFEVLQVQAQPPTAELEEQFGTTERLSDIEQRVLKRFVTEASGRR